MESERPGMLLADSGYPLTTSLLTPLANPVTPAEARYNNAQSKGRMVIEQSFGILKGRFRWVISILPPYTSSNTDFIVEPYFRIEHSLCLLAHLLMHFIRHCFLLRSVTSPLCLQFTDVSTKPAVC